MTVPASAVGDAVLGAVLGVLLRSPALAIAIGLAWMLLVEPILTVTWDGAECVVPGSLLTALAQGGTDDVAMGAALAGAIARVAALTAAWWALGRRDVMS